MENDSSELFNTEALSFDSTLDSLLDVEYMVDSKTIPFNPLNSTPSDILMSAEKSFGGDNAYVDSGRTDCSQPGSATDVMNMEIQENVNDVREDSVEDVNVVIDKQHSAYGNNQKGNVNERDNLERKQKHGKNKPLCDRSPGKRNGKNKQVEIDNGIKESGLSNLRESSPNFDHIKAKRERNLAKRISTKSSASKAGKIVSVSGKERYSLSKCPVNSTYVATDKPNTAYSKSEKDILETGDDTTNEPPTKRLKTIPKKHNRKCVSATVEVVPSDLITKATTDATVEVCPLLVTSTSIENTNQINKSEPISIANSMLSKSAETVKMVVNTESEPHFEKENSLPDKTVQNFNLKGTVQEDELKEQQTEVIVNDEEVNEHADLDEMNMQNIELKAIGTSKDAHNNEDMVGHRFIECETTADQKVEIGIDDVICGLDRDTVNEEEEGIQEQVDGVDDVVDDDEEEEDDDDEDDVDDDEIHNWLEEGLTKEEIREKKKEELKEGEFISSEKSILIGTICSLT